MCWNPGPGARERNLPIRTPPPLSGRVPCSPSTSPFLRDFFRSYKNFDDAQTDTIEIMLSRLYAKWGIDDNIDFSRLAPEDYPILSDLYALMEEAQEQGEEPVHPGIAPVGTAGAASPSVWERTPSSLAATPTCDPTDWCSSM